ncbi:MAG: hypothetical protein AABZ80_03250 [Gemmatimonadota bacterium]
MRKIVIALALGIIAGYWLGYFDAFRGEKAIGSRIRIAMGMVSPEGISAERARRAQMLRDTIHVRSGAADLPN